MDASGYEQLKLLIHGQMTRASLDAIRLIICPPLRLHHVGVAAISGKEIRDQMITLTYMNGYYPVPVDVFAKQELFHIANRIIITHERAHKSPS